MGKNWNHERFIWKSSGIWAFESLIPGLYGGLNLDLFYTVIFFRGTSKNKSSGFAAAMWAHSYL
jgi:hypothetical protein